MHRGQALIVDSREIKRISKAKMRDLSVQFLTPTCETAIISIKFSIKKTTYVRVLCKLRISALVHIITDNIFHNILLQRAKLEGSL